MQNRVMGIDLARALAIFGMIIVNFNLVFSSPKESSLYIVQFLEGKAAASFVFLAGIGIAILLKKNTEINQLKWRLFRRGIALVILGLSYIEIWPADILHYYGIYILITLLFLKSKPRTLLLISGLIIGIYPLILLFFNYGEFWNFNEFSYANFWQLDAFLKNLFINGFHPVLPWLSFMLTGFYFGQHCLDNTPQLKKILTSSSLLLCLIQIVTYFLQQTLSAENEMLRLLLSLSPMPPLPLYMINGILYSLMIISFCLLYSHKINDTIAFHLSNFGKFSLSAYFLHVILGMGLFELRAPNDYGQESTLFIFFYALFFSFFLILFSMFWFKYFKLGPFEFLFNKIK